MMICPFCKKQFLKPDTNMVDSQNEGRVLVVVTCPYCWYVLGATAST